MKNRMSCIAGYRVVPVVSLFVFLLFACSVMAYENEIKSISGKMAENIAKSGKTRVAVVDFTDLQGNVTELGRFIAEEFSVALLSAGKGFEIVDRTHLQSIIKEHKLSTTGLIDPETARKLGQIAGVEALITGTITPFGESVRLSAKILDASTAKLIGANTGNIPKTKAIEELLGKGIVTGGIIPTETAQIPTSSKVKNEQEKPSTSVNRISRFDKSSTEGWTTIEGKSINPGSGGSGGGTNNGCLIFQDTTNGTGYFVAPSKYHGDWRGYSALKLDLWSSGAKYYSSSDIILVSGYATAQRSLSQRPPENWSTFVIPLKDDNEWVYKGGATSLDDVLVNITDFQIRSEYGKDGEDTTGLDNVELVK